MGTNVFEDIHNIGINMLFDNIHKPIKVVVGVSSNSTEYVVKCIVSRSRRSQESYKDNTQDMKKDLLKFRVTELKQAQSITTNKKPIQINLIDYIKYQGVKYNIYRDTINNQTQNLLILEVTNFKW